MEDAEKKACHRSTYCQEKKYIRVLEESGAVRQVEGVLFRRCQAWTLASVHEEQFVIPHRLEWRV